jgi:hypothetical protein
MRAAWTALAVCAVAVSACAEEQSPRALTIKSTTMPLATGEEVPRSIGKLVHRGSLRLTSEDGDFGGVSGLIVSDDGSRFLAITDASHWISGTLEYRDGKLSRASGVEIGQFTAPDGTKLSGKSGDAEGLAGSLDGDVFVSFEGRHRIWRYAFSRDGLTGAPTEVAVPPELAKAPNNGGLEGIAKLTDGRLLAITESFHDDEGNIHGWLLDAQAGVEPLRLKRRAPFDLTDIRQMPNGDVLTLERRFSRLGGVGFAMRRIPGTQIAPDALLDGEVVADAGMNFVIDNMEGLSVRRGSDGETLVYLVSDDNFNAPLQQTLLMMFELKD